MASVASVAQKFKKLTKKPLEKKNLLPPHQLESGDQRDSGEARAKRKLLKKATARVPSITTFAI